MGKQSRRKRPGAAKNNDSTSSGTGASSAVVAAPRAITVAERHRRNRERGDPRADVVRAREEFESLVDADPWNNQRLSALDSYATLMTHHAKPIFDYDQMQDAVKFLKTVRRSKTEPVFYRALAYELTGFLTVFTSFSNADPHGEALAYFDRAIALYESADGLEKERIVFLSGIPTCLGDRYQHKSEYLSKFEYCLNENYALRAWGPHGDDVGFAFIAGTQCDFCETLRKDLGEEHEGLFCCGKCQMEYYCSEDCQRKAWYERGHRLRCRKKGEIQPGDIMILTKSVGGIPPGHAVQIVGPDPDNMTSRWIVKEQERNSDKGGCVSAKSLKRVRALLWYPFDREDLRLISAMLAARDNQSNKSEESEDAEQPLPVLLSHDLNEEESDSDDDDEQQQNINNK